MILIDWIERTDSVYLYYGRLLALLLRTIIIALRRTIDLIDCCNVRHRRAFIITLFEGTRERMRSNRQPLPIN